MKIKGLDNKQYSINLSEYLNKINNNASSYHIAARSLIKDLYPLDVILEEVYLPGCSTQLYLDFLLPHRKFGIEVHGEQHYSFSEHYHGNQDGFRRSQVRDIEKIRWCEINDIVLVELSYKETIDEWRQRICNR